MPAVREASILRLALLGAGLVAACKPAPHSRVPGRADLDTYLAALEDNEGELRAAGVVVAKAEPARVGTTPAGPPAEPAPDVSVDRDLDEDAEPADDAVFAPEPEADMPARSSAPVAESRARRAAGVRQRRDDDRHRCTRICDLAEMACELEVRICELAQDHPGEARYETACTRARNQCATAADACRSCD